MKQAVGNAYQPHQNVRENENEKNAAAAALETISCKDRKKIAGARR